MYIKTKDALINMRNKDIEITNYSISAERFYVVARGPVGGFWESESLEIRDSFHLFEGTEKDCRLYFNGLCQKIYMNSPVIDGNFEAVTELDVDLKFIN